MPYDDAKYGVINRMWIGRTPKLGGTSSAAVALIASGTTKTVMTQFLPRGPINIEKFGIQVVATLSSADNSTGCVKRQRQPVELWKGTTSTPRTTLMGSVHAILGDTGRTALWGVASVEGAALASQEVEAGKVLNIFLATPNSDNGTAMTVIGTIAGGGTLAYFIDFRPKFDQSKWEAT